MSKVLVTGGGGFLGSAIVRGLVKRGDAVRSFSRGFYPELERLGVEQVQGDISEPDAVERACTGVDIVFHTAAKPGVWGDYQCYYQTNVLGTENILAGCQKAGVDRLIHTSSPSVIFDGKDMEGVDASVPYPETFHAHYPKTKALAEMRVRKAAEAGLPAIILRPHLIWGPGDNHLVPRILAKGKNGRLARVGDGKNLVDTIYIDNAADAHLLAADALARNPDLSGSIYFISQDEPIPLWEMVDRILEAGGLPKVKKRVSAKTAYRLGAFFEGLYKSFHIDSEPPMTRFVAGELATAHWFDIEAARTDLGYHPKISAQEGFRRLALWLKENPEKEIP